MNVVLIDICVSHFGFSGGQGAVLLDTSGGKGLAVFGLRGVPDVTLAVEEPSANDVTLVDFD